MNEFKWKYIGVVIALTAVIASVAIYGVLVDTDNEILKKTNGIIPLAPPSFIQMAEASGVTNPSNGASFLEDEAGISAYTNVGEEIDLGLATNAFRTIEYTTSEYIIGSVGLTDYPETEDVHCYIHKDGWIVSYYLRDETTAKILDWEDYSTDEKITGTKLEDGIIVVCDVAGVLPGEIVYYHFNYPNAEELMIIAESVWQYGTEEFNVSLPFGFVFYERSYSHYSGGYSSQMKINDDLISSLSNKNTNYGPLSVSQLPVGIKNNIKLYRSSYGSLVATGAIVLIYRET